MLVVLVIKRFLEEKSQRKLKKRKLGRNYDDWKTKKERKSHLKADIFKENFKESKFHL
jgi:hypothetical protein